jgi:hypothetical protein
MEGTAMKIKLRYLIAVVAIVSLSIGGLLWNVRAQKDALDAAYRAAKAAEADAVARTK